MLDSFPECKSGNQNNNEIEGHTADLNFVKRVEEYEQIPIDIRRKPRQRYVNDAIERAGLEVDDRFRADVVRAMNLLAKHNDAVYQQIFLDTSTLSVRGMYHKIYTIKE